ncbi:MAG: helix-turn-helix domain-containing protein [Phycisphaera sp.]|nr:MAG: helix-turn-helix domain-containing protein [Phycisphaera sp.]
MGQEADNRAAKRTPTPANPVVSAAVIEPQVGYTVDPQRLKRLRGTRTMVELVAGIAGFSSDKYRKIESGKTRTVVGSDLCAIAGKLGVPPTALLSMDHPDRTMLPGRAESAVSLPVMTSGQAHNVERVIEGLDQDVRIQTLTGPRGVGKSTVAMHLITETQRRLDTRARFASLLDQCQPWELWRSLGVQSIGRDADSGRTRVEVIDALRDDTAVLILDVDGTPCPSTIEQIETITRFCDGLNIVVAAERALDLPGERVEPIEPVRFDPKMVSSADDLGESDAWQLVVAELPRDRASNLLDGVRFPELVSLLGLGDGTPGWFVAVGRELREHEPGDIARRIATRELSFSSGADRTWDQRVRRASESISIDQLSVLAILPRSFVLEDIRGLAGLGTSEIERILGIAQDHWLIEKNGDRFIIPRAAQQACARLGGSAHQRAIDGLLARLPAHDAPPQELAAFDVHGHMAALHLAAIGASEGQMPDLAKRIIALLIPACMRPTRWSEVTAMAVDLERRLADIEGISTVPIARWAGTGALVTGDLDAARYWAGRCVERATKNVERAAGLNVLAACRLSGKDLSRSDLDDSLADWIEARRLYDEVDDTMSVLTMDANIAIVYESVGDLDASLESTSNWSQIGGILHVQLAITRARVLLRVGRTDEAIEIITAIKDDDALANPMASIAFVTLLAFAVLAREGVTLPRSRLDGRQGSGSADYSLAAEALARSKLIAMLEGIDPGLLDRIDWAWVESTVTPRAITELQDAGDVSGLARRVLKTQA